MARHTVISYPRKWIEPQNWIEADGATLAHWEINGYWQSSYSEAIELTPEEETARDAEETAFGIAKAARDEVVAQLASLHAKLMDDTITDAETREMLRLERS